MKESTAPKKPPTGRSTAEAKSEAELIEGFLRKKPPESNRCFDELVRTHQRKIYEVAFRYLGNHDDASEICQKTFVRMHQKLASFQGRSQLRTWLYRIAINLCKNYHRDEKRRGDFRKEWVGYKRESNPAEQPFHKGPLATEAAGGAATAGALERLESEERRETMQRAVKHLPEKQQIIMNLRVYEELTFKEIAEAVGSSVNAAKANFHYALKNLKDILKEKK